MKKNTQIQTRSLRPLRTVSAEALRTVQGGLNFTKITFTYAP